MNINNINDSNSFPIHHAPLVFDINAQRCYRRWGFVSCNQINSLKKGSDSTTKNEDPSEVMHSPLIVDMNTQRIYRKTGFVSWPIKE